jgi:hypothetical protein
LRDGSGFQGKKSRRNGIIMICVDGILAAHLFVGVAIYWRN